MHFSSEKAIEIGVREEKVKSRRDMRAGSHTSASIKG
jgi:hypothetical protein